MHGILDNFLVGLALLVSVVYAVLALGPRNLRRRLLAALSRGAARAPAVPGMRRMAHWLAASAGKSQGACGGCDDCGSKKSPSPEVSVPVAKISRRG